MGNLHIFLKVIIFCGCIFTATILSAQSAEIKSKSAQQQEISLLKNELKQVESRSEALNRIINPATDISEIIGSDVFSNDLYIKMNEKIDQKFYHTKFKVLSVDAPIIYKLFT